MKDMIWDAIQNKTKMPDEKSVIEQFQNSNPEFWETYYLIARYFQVTGAKADAIDNYSWH
ncbi:MAG: hypothetical protein IPP77_03635 [Bacteroidetes bacterium]|nr:hypothetical protein [Bacteroidota bacterium]